MKDTLTVIILLIVFLLAMFILYIKVFMSKLMFDFRISDIGVNKFNLGDLINKGQSLVELSVSTVVFNRNKLPLLITDLYAEIYYNNQLVASSSKNIKNLSPIHIPSNGSLIFDEMLDTVVNENTINMLGKSINKIPFEYSYKVKFKIYGLPITVSEKSLYHEDTVAKTITA